LRAAKRKAYVSPTVDDMTVFYDQDADKQDESSIVALGILVSKRLKSLPGTHSPHPRPSPMKDCCLTGPSAWAG